MSKQTAESNIDELAVLEKAVEVIKQWHNFPGSISMLPEKELERMWELYYNNAPEMKIIRETIKAGYQAKQSPADDLKEFVSFLETGRLLGIDEFRKWLNQFDKEEISMSKFVENINLKFFHWCKSEAAKQSQEQVGGELDAIIEQKAIAYSTNKVKGPTEWEQKDPAKKKHFIDGAKFALSINEYQPPKQEQVAGVWVKADVLKQAVQVIKDWHNADEVWDIYYNNAPEMKAIREALSESQQPKKEGE